MSVWAASRRPTTTTARTTKSSLRLRDNGIRARGLCPRPGSHKLPLRELEAAAGFGLAVFLALDHAGVAGEEAAALEHAAQLRLVAHQRLGKTVAHRAGLA